MSMTSMSAVIVTPLTITGIALVMPSAHFLLPCILDMSRLDALSMFRVMASKKCLKIILTDEPLFNMSLKLYPTHLAVHVSGVISFVMVACKALAHLIAFVLHGIFFFGIRDL